jgi:anaerobic magnesium-protoporphyrin IX monomethyl ester cyclase
MARAPQIDGMFVGEPEDGIVQLAQLPSIDRLADVPSLTWRDATGIVRPHSSHGSFVRFASMPYPAWDLVALDRYALPLVNKRYVIVETSRGCPYTCDFCVAPIHQGHKFRERSAKALVDEIERTHRELGVDFFYLWGDTVTLNVKTFSAFCEELIARNLPIQWFGNARADNLTDPAFVHRLKRSGCWMLALGIESESDDVRKDMVKRLDRQKIEAAFKNMRDAGIRSFAFFIFGYPGETPDSMDQTIDYAIELDPDFANFYPAVPYPGTALYDKCVRESLLPPELGNDWAKMEYSYYLLRGNGLDEPVVMEAINRAKRRFFLRPSYMARHVSDVARIAFSKQNIVWGVLSRTLFGTRVVDTSTSPRPQSAAVEG